MFKVSDLVNATKRVVKLADMGRHSLGKAPARNSKTREAARAESKLDGMWRVVEVTRGLNFLQLRATDGRTIAVQRIHTLVPDDDGFHGWVELISPRLLLLMSLAIGERDASLVVMSNEVGLELKGDLGEASLARLEDGQMAESTRSADSSSDWIQADPSLITSILKPCISVAKKSINESFDSVFLSTKKGTLTASATDGRSLYLGEIPSIDCESFFAASIKIAIQSCLMLIDFIGGEDTVTLALSMPDDNSWSIRVDSEYGMISTPVGESKRNSIVNIVESAVGREKSSLRVPRKDLISSVKTACAITMSEFSSEGAVIRDIESANGEVDGNGIIIFVKGTMDGRSKSRVAGSGSVGQEGKVSPHLLVKTLRSMSSVEVFVFNLEGMTVIRGENELCLIAGMA